MDINTIITYLEAQGATVLAYDVQPTFFEIAFNITNYEMYKNCLSILESNSNVDYPTVEAISYFGDIGKFKAK